MWGSMLCSSFDDVLNPLVTFLLNVYGLVVAIVPRMDGFKKKKKLKIKNLPPKKSRNNGKEPWFVSS